MTMTVHARAHRAVSDQNRAARKSRCVLNCAGLVGTKGAPQTHVAGFPPENGNASTLDPKDSEPFGDFRQRVTVRVEIN